MAVDLVVYLNTSDEVIIKRLTGRLVCSKCGANFHVTNMPPKSNGVCDNCQGSLYQRSDDNEVTVRKRLEVYKNVSCFFDKILRSAEEIAQLERRPGRNGGPG
jgi:adenylate kinase